MESLVEEQMRNNNYSALHLTCRCSNCSKRPIWAYADNMGIRLLKVLKDLCLVAAVFIFLFDCLGWLEHKPVSPMPLLYALIPVAVYYCWLFVRYIVKTVGTSLLDVQYLPVVTPKGY